MVNKKKAVFLDRDGVLVKSIIRKKKGYAPKNMKEFSLYPNISEPCGIIKKKKYIIIIITNQPDIGNGKTTMRIFNKMNRILKSKISFDKLYVSISHSLKSKYRKPNPGLFKLAVKKYNLDITKCFMVGDRKSDIDAAHKIGCKAIFIDRKYAEEKPRGYIAKVVSLKKAIDVITKKGN